MRALLLVCLMLVGCGGTDGEVETGSKTSASCPTGDPVCEAGKTEACACIDGTSGVQTCESDGASWGECKCLGEEPGPKAYKLEDVCKTIVDGTIVGCSTPRAGKDCDVPADGYVEGCLSMPTGFYKYCCL